MTPDPLPAPLSALPLAPHAIHAVPTSQRRPRRWLVPAGAVLLLAAAAGGWHVLHPSAAPAVAVKKAAGPAPVELASADVAMVGAQALSLSLPLSGSLTPVTQATLKSKVSGVVQATTVQEGMSVAAGQVLARIDAADSQARLMQQQGALDQARAKLSLANKNQFNNEKLLQQKYISQTAYDTAQNSVELAQADVKSADAMVEIARIALNDSVIRAPFAGVVSKRFVQAGDKLSPDLAIFTIVNLSQMTLEAQVPASDVPRVKPGQTVQFQVDGFDQRQFSGTVVRINPTAEAGSRAMLVYIAVDNQDGALRGGMFAKGTVTTARSAVQPQVPLAAVRTAQGKALVYTVERNQIVAHPVTLGLRNDDDGLVEVTSGLVPGSTVLVSRLDGIKPGDRVVLPAPAPGAAITPAAKSAELALGRSAVKG